MRSTAVPGVLARTAELLDSAGEAKAGALWRLAVERRQLDAGLMRLAPEAEEAVRTEPLLDVLLCVVSGEGRLETEAGVQELRPGCVAWLPRGSRWTVTAGVSGLVYLTAQGRRPGPAISAAVAPEGGDPACLLHRVCTECGRLAPESDARFCGRCGERLPVE